MLSSQVKKKKKSKKQNKNKKLRGRWPPQLGLGLASVTLDWPPLYFILFYFNLGWGHFEKKKIKMVKLQQFRRLGSQVSHFKHLR
jgi:hypothetical protein